MDLIFNRKSQFLIMLYTIFINFFFAKSLFISPPPIPPCPNFTRRRKCIKCPKAKTQAQCTVLVRRCFFVGRCGRESGCRAEPSRCNCAIHLLCLMLPILSMLPTLPMLPMQMVWLCAKVVCQKGAKKMQLLSEQMEQMLTVVLSHQSW